jgi:hypothetical protein
MSCSSCNKQTKTTKNYMDDINSIYDDNYLINAELDKSFNNSIINNDTGHTYKLPTYISNNADEIFNNTVYKYLNFTRLKNACEIIDGIKNDNDIDVISKDSICYDTFAHTKDEIKKTLNCSEQIDINGGVSYWINGINEQLINPEFLIPNIFRKCQYNTLECPTQVNIINLSNNTSSTISNTIFYKMQSSIYNRPLLIDGDIIMGLLYDGIVADSIDISDDKYEPSIKNKQNKQNKQKIKPEYLCFIFSMLNFNYDTSLSWTMLNIMRYYGNSLLFELIDFISRCFKANEYFNEGRQLCSFRIPWASTVVCYFTEDNTCYKNEYYSEFPLTFEQLKIIYKTTILNNRILYFLNSNQPISCSSNNLSIIFYYALKVFRDVLLEMKYNVSPYNSIVQNKCYCKKPYMYIKPDKNGSNEDKAMYLQLKKYICANKQRCIPLNPALYKYMCIEIYDLNSFTDDSGTTTKILKGPSLNSLYVEDEKNHFKGKFKDFTGKQFKGNKSDILTISIVNETSFYNYKDCGYGPLLIDQNYNFKVELTAEYKKKYRLMYLWWGEQPNDYCTECNNTGCNTPFSNNKLEAINEPKNCNCIMTDNIVNTSPTLTRGGDTLLFSINNLSSNYCLRIFVYKYIETFYVEDAISVLANDKLTTSNFYNSFDIGLWNNHFNYTTTGDTNLVNYANTFHLPTGIVVTNTTTVSGICADKDLNSFEIPIKQQVNGLILNQIGTTQESIGNNCIVPFSVYSAYDTNSGENYTNHFSQFYYIDANTTPIQPNSQSSSNIYASFYKNTAELIPSGTISSPCTNFLTTYINDKLFYINVLSYIPYYTFLTISQPENLNGDPDSKYIKDCLNADTGVSDKTNNSESINSESINPDIYFIEDPASYSSSNPNKWFILNHSNGNLNKITDTSKQITHDFDYLWFPPLDIQLSADESIQYLPIIKTYNKYDTNDKNGDPSLRTNIFYDDNLLITDIFTSNQKPPNFYFGIDKPITITKHTHVIKRNGPSMSALLQKSYITTQIPDNDFPYIIDFNNNISTNPNSNFNYSIQDYKVSGRTLSSNLKFPTKSGLFFNTKDDALTGIFKNDITVNNDGVFVINKPLYYLPESDITLANNNTTPIKSIYPQPYTNMRLPYEYQCDYYKNQTTYNKPTNITITPDASISSIPPKFNYVLPIYKPNIQLNITIDYYTSCKYLPSSKPLSTGIKSFVVAPSLPKETLTPYVNNTLLYTMPKGTEATDLDGLAKNGLYSWGQYSSLSNTTGITKITETTNYPNSNTPKIRYADPNNQYDDFKNQFSTFIRNKYYLECSSSDQLTSTNIKKFVDTTSDYPNGNYISIAPINKNLTKNKKTNMYDINASLVLYPITVFNPYILKNSRQYINPFNSFKLIATNNSNNIENDDNTITHFNISLQSDKNILTTHYIRKISIQRIDTPEVGYNTVNKNIHYVYCNPDQNNPDKNNLFGLLYYDSLTNYNNKTKYNYFPYENGEFSFNVTGSCIYSPTSSDTDNIQIIYPTKSASSELKDIPEELIPVPNTNFNTINRKYIVTPQISNNSNNSNNSKYNLTTYENENLEPNSISGPNTFNLKYNFITFFNPPKSTGSFTIKIDYTGVNNGDYSLSSDIIYSKNDNKNLYFGLNPEYTYTFNITTGKTLYSNAKLIINRANGDEWEKITNIPQEHENIITLKKSDIIYDTYFDIKLIGQGITINTNYSSKILTYPLQFNDSTNGDLIQKYNICSNPCINPIWSRYIINGDGCDCDDRIDIPTGFLINITSPATSKACSILPISADTLDNTGMFVNTVYSASSTSSASSASTMNNSIKDAYDLFSGNSTMSYDYITQNVKSKIFIQDKVRQNNLYTSTKSIKLTNKTFGYKMSMTNSMIIAGSPDNRLITETSSGLINIYNISNQQNLLYSVNEYLLDCCAHYSIYNPVFQTMFLYSSTKDDKPNSTITQIVIDNGVLIPTEITNITSQTNFLTGISIDIFETTSAQYQLYSVVGSIPDISNKGTGEGNITIYKNDYLIEPGLSTKKSVMTQVVPPITLSSLSLSSSSSSVDQFGYKVKVVYVDTSDNVYIMCINRFTSSTQTSQAVLIKFNYTNNKNTVSVEDKIDLSGYEIYDATAIVCDGDTENSRIVMYLSIKQVTTPYDIKLNIINNDDNLTDILQVEFNISTETGINNGKYKLSDKNKILSSIGDNTHKTYETDSENDEIKKQVKSMVFGSTIDVSQSNINFPLNDGTELYRTNFLLTNRMNINSGNNLISNSISIYCDSVIEECNSDNSTDKCSDKNDNINFNSYYSTIYKGANPDNNAINNIELFSISIPIENTIMKTIYSRSIDNVEVLNDCSMELPDYIAISTFSPKTGSEILIYNLNTSID